MDKAQTQSAKLFAQHQQHLEGLLKNEAKPLEHYQQYNYFVKCDISGIQDFIFYVQSKGAAKTLKARSFYVQALCDVVQFILEEKLGKTNVELLYNGGGNFYLFIKSDDEVTLNKQLATIRTELDDKLHKESHYIILSKVKTIPSDFTSEEGFGKKWETLNKLCNAQKLQKFNTYAKGFEPYKNPDANNEQLKELWRKFSGQLTKHKSFTIEKKPNENNGVGKKRLYLFNTELCLKEELSSNPAWNFEHKIVNKLPYWHNNLFNEFTDFINAYNEPFKNLPDKEREAEEIKKDNIVEFSSLAHFAKIRTGTAKLGVLKMDIDDLGSLFAQIKNIKYTHQLSLAMYWFFEEFLVHLLEQSFPYYQLVKQPDGTNKYTKKTAYFKDNIYTVFAGGDDCFFVGAWDAILQFTQQLQANFNAFQKYLGSQDDLGEALKTEEEKRKQKQHQITLSAGVLILDAHFPVIRFAKAAEEALEQAKHHTRKNLKEEGKLILKNSISIFGQVLSWNEFNRVINLSNELQTLIQKHGESRAILNRIKHSAKGYDNLQQRIARGESIYTPKVWRLQYYLRNVKKANLKNVEPIINEYTCALVNTFAKQQTTNPIVFPIAARIAEFLTRK